MALSGEGRLAGCNALITGAAGRLGQAIAERFSQEGARLCLVDKAGRDIPSPAHDRADVMLYGDLDKQDEAEILLVDAVKRLGTLDVVVNCAGTYGARSFLKTDADSWRRAFATNLDTTVNISRAAAAYWIGAGRPGAIVNLTSAASLFPRPGTIEYVAGKSALNGLTSALAMELGPHGIRVNAVAPGMVLDRVYSSDMEINDTELQLALNSTPLGRTGSPQDVAAAVVFLASQEAAWITGVILPVTGGAHFGRPHFPTAG